MAEVVADSIAGITPEETTKLTDPGYLLGLAIGASGEESEGVAMVAVERVVGEAELTEVALKASSEKVGLAAVRRVGSQGRLARVAAEANRWQTRKGAFEKLSQDKLTELAGTTAASAVGTAARIRTGTTTWDQVLASVNMGQTGVGLSDLVGAVALVEQPAPPSQAVVDVCHRLIRLGDESCIPELCDLLLRLGDKPLAEDYLNCGHPRLAEAAAEWGRRRRLRIEAGWGSARVRWGSRH